MFTHRHAAALLAVFALGAGAAPASASTTDQILRECAQTGTVADGHTPAELRKAAADMPADAAEYSPCPDEVDRALRRALATPTPLATVLARSGAAGKAAADKVSPEELAAALELAGPEGVAPTITDPQREEAPATTPDEANAGPADGAARREEPRLGDPAAKAVGNLVAAATVGASLLALARPAMLRRRRIDDQE